MLFPKTEVPKTKPRRQPKVVNSPSGLGVMQFIGVLLSTNTELPEEKKYTDHQLAFKIESEFWDHFYPEEPGKAARERTLDSLRKSLWAYRYKYNQGVLFAGQPPLKEKSVAYDEKGLPVRYGDISSLEAKFIEGWVQNAPAGLPGPDREVFFHPSRKWRIDFAWLPLKVGVEIQGGTWTAKSRHNSGSGLSSCYEKLNEAQRLGWVLLQMDAKYLTKANTPNTIKYVVEVLEEVKQRNGLVS